MTAAHVFTEMLNKLDKGYLRHHETAYFTPEEPIVRTWSNLDLLVGVTTADGRTFPAPVTRSAYSQAHDLAFLFVDLPEHTTGFRFDLAIALKSDGPMDGDTVFPVGYFRLADRTEEMIPPIVPREFFAGFEFVDGNVSCIESKVVRLHPDGVRGKKWPAFQVNTPFNSGMSGGAILGVKDGECYVCGVISCDMSIGDEMDTGSGHEAIAGIIRPALLHRIPEPFTYAYEESGRIHEHKISCIQDLINCGAIRDLDS